ncbi:type 4a pilus biogenesis protein PilO [Desulfobulbus alkaliphilus]|uniref:type 4a pilus biogenesis protein PilO n=1 Tax=Desulfobulbus alkaliphilus TaxID=869814 RepID=UPI001964D8FF|nr:type 4a pilus biogenesis protein PilO [Desulfobulbus alkaliphilus]MBM9536574.1 type 4a pilus biogenesis protein PilO [Desulfobulbus alkaliphilus]
MAMKKLTKLESFGLIAVILVSGSYFYMKKVYDPEAEALKRSISQLNSTIASYNRLGAPPHTMQINRQIEELQGELDNLTEELLEAGGRTGTAAEVTEMLASISTMARNHHMTVLKISPEREVRDELFIWQAVNVQLRGRYQDFVALIESLKGMAQPVQLSRLRIERDPGNEGAVLITATLLV